MGQFIDRTGQRFGKLTVISYSGNSKWLCRCDCGKELTVQANNLHSGHTISCGCARKDAGENRKLDLTGKRFGRLTVLKRAGYHETGHTALWECVCECGNSITVRGTNLRTGATKSCGCYSHERLVELHTTHGERDTRLYSIWVSMRQRCEKEYSPSYSDYGARGITVCKEWKESYETFRDWAVDNGYTDELTIDRIDNDKGYCPENCRWATAKQQARNRRSNRPITFNGETHLVTDWEDILGFSRGRIMQRIDRLGWSVERALTEPIRKIRKKKEGG